MDFLGLDLMSFNKSLQQFTRTAKQQTLQEKIQEKGANVKLKLFLCLVKEL